MVAVILLIFLSISFKKSNENFTESFVVESFVQSFLSYTTSCELGYDSNYQNLRQAISSCEQNKTCLDGRGSCDVLNQTIKKILEDSWKVGKDYPNKGYSLNITTKGKELISFEEGNKTDVSKGSLQSFDRGLDIIFIVYN